MSSGTLPTTGANLSAGRSGRRLTARTRRVLAQLTGREVPASAQQLHAELRAAGDRTGLATVYRALHTLAQAGLVHEFRRAEETGYRVCGPTPHDHLVCAGCGRVQERQLTRLQDTLAGLQREGFLVTSGHIEVHGLCARCPAPHPAAVATAGPRRQPCGDPTTTRTGDHTETHRPTDVPGGLHRGQRRRHTHRKG